MSPLSADEALGRLLRGAGGDRTIAVIWATVDLARASAALGLDGEPLAEDPLLGASVRLVRPPGEEPVALLEPAREGRLAATLARAGEGPAGRYVAVPDELASLAGWAADLGLRLGRPADGPFGRSALLLGGPLAGPHLVLVERPAGTIAR